MNRTPLALLLVASLASNGVFADEPTAAEPAAPADAAPAVVAEIAADTATAGAPIANAQLDLNEPVVSTNAIAIATAGASGYGAEDTAGLYGFIALFVAISLVSFDSVVNTPAQH